MTAGHVYNHFILHTQQIFTLGFNGFNIYSFWKLCYSKERPLYQQYIEKKF